MKRRVLITFKCLLAAGLLLGQNTGFEIGVSQTVRLDPGGRQNLTLKVTVLSR